MLKSRLPLIAAELKARIEASIQTGAMLVEQKAKARVPVDDGDLRDAIHVDKGGGGFYVVAGNEQVFYGHLVERGTTHSAPQPFLVPALEESRGDIVALASAALKGL